MGALVGIDLGTTHSLVAVFDDGAPRVLADALGQTMLPSVIAVADDGALLVGAAARERMTRQADAGIARFKTDMGSDRAAPLGEHRLDPTQLSALVLRELKATAEAALGVPVDEAVITVPAWFKEPQRRATVAAAALAGLKVSRLIHEPTAAALAWGLTDTTTERVVVVLDLGGGTFDVSVLEIFEGVVEVLSSSGDTHLGGEDFTDALVERAHQALGVATLAPAVRGALRHRCEQAKRRLSTEPTVVIQLPQPLADRWVDGATFEVRREDFDGWTAGLLGRLRACVREALVHAKKAPAAIDEVLLVGGATRGRAVRRLAGELFGRLPRTDLDPDHVVALGAAVQAALMAGEGPAGDVVLTDITPFSLGVGISRQVDGQLLHDQFDAILHRGTTIPVSRVTEYSTVHPGQTKVRMTIYQGEKRVASQNERLGELVLTVPPHDTPDAREALEVRFSHDTNGLLHVEATVVSSGERADVVIQRRAEALEGDALTAALAAMERLKVEPRELLPNRYSLERAHRVFEGLNAEQKPLLDGVLLRYEAALQRGEPAAIAATRAALDRVVADLVADLGLDLDG